LETKGKEGPGGMDSDPLFTAVPLSALNDSEFKTRLAIADPASKGKANIK
jgi:hypothetical protein